jgi:ZIP family zinc transporter
LVNGYIHTLSSGLIGFGISGIGIGIGGASAYLIRYARRQLISLLITVTAGLIITLICFEIIPESIRAGGILLTGVGFAIGYLLAKQIERFSRRIVVITNSAQKDIFIRSGILLAFAVALHNLPSGISFGASLLSTPELAKSLAVAMIVHAIPEGIVLGLPFVLASLPPWTMLLTSVVVGFPTAIGTILGYKFGMMIPGTLSFMLGIAVGTMLYITWFEILEPALKEIGQLKSVIGMFIGVIFGGVYAFFL